MPWNSLFVLAGSKFCLRIPFGKPHTARVADSLWAGVCGANVLTLCFPSPSAFFKREKTEFFREFSNAENSLFFCHFVVFSSKKIKFYFAPMISYGILSSYFYCIYHENLIYSQKSYRLYSILHSVFQSNLFCGILHVNVRRKAFFRIGNGRTDPKKGFSL